MQGQRAWSIAGVAAVAVVAAGVGGYFGLRGHIGAAGSNGAVPPPRSLAAMAYDESTRTVVLFGGAGAGGGLLDDTWTWDGGAWTQQHPAVSPPARRLARMTYDPATHDVLLFGGAGLADTWLWDGGDWKQASGSPPGPAASGGFGAGLATDPSTGQVLLVASAYGIAVACPPPAPAGGAPVLQPCTSPPQVADLAWRWTGSGWEPLANPPNTGPAGFAGAGGLVADPATGHIAYFRSGLASGGCGGWSGYVPASSPPVMPCRGSASGSTAAPAPALPQCCSGSVTSWNGSSWSAARAFTGGPELVATTLAGDPANDEVVALTGGVTWTWNGKGWTRPHAPSGPGLLEGAAVAFDGASRRVLEFGGSRPGAVVRGTPPPPSDATWAWDGSAWNLVAGTVLPQASPAPPPVPPVTPYGPPPIIVPPSFGVACPEPAQGAHPGQDLMPACVGPAVSPQVP